jgi:hypothetical protein
MPPTITNATPSHFRAEDAVDPRFYVLATLASGLLRFEIVAKLPNGDRGSVSGKELFGAMVAHFGSRIKIIEGNWNKASGLTTNLEMFNRATAAGLSEQDAAALTWTGIRASEYGYNTVSVPQSVGAPGNYDDVYAQFSR